MLPVLALLQFSSIDTVRIRPVEQAPTLQFVDSAHLGTPQIRIRTRQGVASMWLLRARDTVLVAARIRDTTSHWLDELAIYLDTRGNDGPAPDHDDFQLSFRRVLDSSVVYRGRNGRWEPPRGDPDWRLGPDRSGGGWEISSRGDRDGWTLLIRLDPAWFEGVGERVPRLAFQIYDNAPGGWFPWPRPGGSVPARSVERVPATWAPAR